MYISSRNDPIIFPFQDLSSTYGIAAQIKGEEKDNGVNCAVDNEQAQRYERNLCEHLCYPARHFINCRRKKWSKQSAEDFYDRPDLLNSVSRAFMFLTALLFPFEFRCDCVKKKDTGEILRNCFGKP